MMQPSFLPPSSAQAYSGLLFQTLELQDIQNLPIEPVPNPLPGISLELGYISKPLHFLVGFLDFFSIRAVSSCPLQ